jgi:organic radical activating enzyme
MKNKIKILNYRYGFASNSSSSHSIVVINDNKLKEVEDDVEYSDNGFYFGWDWFTAFSTEMKQIYLFSLMRYSFPSLSEEYIYGILKYILNIKSIPTIENLKNSIIDHESYLFFPKQFNSEFPDPKFLLKFAEFVLSEEVAILGGNDNEENGHPLNDCSLMIPFDKYFGVAKWVSKQGLDEDTFTLFNRKNGTKIRILIPSAQFLSLTQEHNKDKKIDEDSIYREDLKYAGVHFYAKTPELMDLKITDKCFNDCEFCYMNSNSDGEHAETKNVENILNLLADLEVFEVAFGGGDPSIHPDIKELIKYAFSKNIIPNITINSHDNKWLFNNWEFLSKYVGAIGLSVGKFKFCNNLNYYIPDLLNKIEHLINVFPMNINIHLCYWQLTKKEIISVLKKIYKKSFILNPYNNPNIKDIKLLLLGYKDCGRKFKVITDEHKMLDIMNEFMKKNPSLFLNNKAFSIDTLFAKRTYSQLLEMGVSKFSFELIEGFTSGYIDCVDNKQYRASYLKDDNQSIMKYDSPDSSVICENFRFFQNVANKEGVEFDKFLEELQAQM